MELYLILLSHPLRGEWIEITYAGSEERDQGQSHPLRGEWIEIDSVVPLTSTVNVSPPAG